MELFLHFLHKYYSVFFSYAMQRLLKLQVSKIINLNLQKRSKNGEPWRLTSHPRPQRGHPQAWGNKVQPVTYNTNTIHFEHNHYPYYTLNHKTTSQNQGFTQRFIHWIKLNGEGGLPQWGEFKLCPFEAYHQCPFEAYYQCPFEAYNVYLPHIPPYASHKEITR